MQVAIRWRHLPHLFGPSISHDFCRQQITNPVVQFESVSSRTVDIDRVHVDLYRLDNASELDNLGLRDLLPGSRLWLIEWPEKGAGRLPPADLTLHWRVEGQGRAVNLQANTPRGQQWLGRLPAGAVS